MVQIVGAFGTQSQKIEALGNALDAMGEAYELLKQHPDRIDPDGSVPGKPEERIPLNARFA